MKALTATLFFIFMVQCLFVSGQEEKEKSAVRVVITYYQENENLPLLKISTKTKKGKRFEAVDSILVNVFFNEETAQGFAGRVKTNSKGEGSMVLPERFRSNWDTLSTYTFIATVTGNDFFEDTSGELEITRARIELTLKEEDSIKTVQAKLLAYEDGTWIAVPDAEIKLMAKRLLNDINAGEEESYTTDESGASAMTFNKILPGDKDGMLTVAVKVEDHEMYGNLSATKSVAWGIPQQKDNSFAERSLWATRDKTPLWLLIFPNLAIAVVWIIIFYLMYQIAVINKLGKEKKNI